MNKALFLLLTILSLSTLPVHAQKMSEKIENLGKDPMTADRAAKADIYKMDKNKISDKALSTAAQPVPTPAKKKKCRKQNIS